MRQAGILAAAGLVALRDGGAGTIERLAEDHANAHRLAEAIASTPGIESPGDIAQPGDGPLDPDRVVTNFVLFRVAPDGQAFIDACAARGLLLDWFPHRQIRAATHLGVGPAEIERAIEIIGASLVETKPARDARTPSGAAH
jgi:threonine aldolase